MPTISLARGIPAPELIPVSDLVDCARAVLERDGETVLNYGPPGGYAPLRSWLAEQHHVEPERILLTNGSLQGLDLVMARFASERRVLVEAPTYDRALAIARRHGADVHDVPHDAEGVDLQALEQELRSDRRAALLYLLPTFQNPTGRTLSLERRGRLLELAADHDLVLLEDDPYRLVRFEGEDLPALLELDDADRVVHSSSFSKIVAPGVRVGHLVAPPDLVRELEAAALGTYLSPAIPTQAVVFEFVRRGLLEANVVRVRELLRERRDALADALERDFPEATFDRPEGGYVLWLELPAGVDSREAVRAGHEAGIALVSGCDFFLRPDEGVGAVRLAFSFASPGEIAEGVARLAGVCAALVPA